MEQSLIEKVAELNPNELVAIKNNNKKVVVQAKECVRSNKLFNLLLHTTKAIVYRSKGLFNIIL